MGQGTVRHTFREHHGRRVHFPHLPRRDPDAYRRSRLQRSHGRRKECDQYRNTLPLGSDHRRQPLDEEGQIPDSDDVFGQKLIGAHKVATRIKVSEELLNDSAFDLEGYFVSEFGRRIGNKEEEAFFTGNGSGKPTGILDGTAGADVGVTTTSASAITADEIIDLFYSLNVPYRKDAIWILNDSTLKAVRKLKDGTGQYLWQPALHEGSFDTLLGKRIFVSPYMPEIASGAKTVAFGDFKFYWIGDRQGITFRRLNELYAENGQVGFIASKRVDGKLILPEAIKVLKQKT